MLETGALLYDLCLHKNKNKFEKGIKHHHFQVKCQKNYQQNLNF